MSFTRKKQDFFNVKKKKDFIRKQTNVIKNSFLLY